MERYRGMPPTVVLDLQQTARILALASYLMYVLDTRKPKKEEQEAQPEFEFEFLKPD